MARGQASGSTSGVTRVTSSQEEPRWIALIIVLAGAGLHVFLPPRLTAGPGWLPVGFVAAFSLPLIWTHRELHHRWNQILGYMICAVITAALAYSLFMLIGGLKTHAESPDQLLRSAAILWATNVVIFAAWYWRLDGGGPHTRSQNDFHQQGAFLFPQMTLSPEAREAAGIENWRPHFLDYLFLSFNSSTAFSPTDVPVLSRWAKILMMTQATISLMTLAILAARAVNMF